MRSMKDWNWFRSSNGPRLILHKTGRMSIATKSVSAIPPTTRKTFKAATIKISESAFAYYEKKRHESDLLSLLLPKHSPSSEIRE